MYSSLNKLLYLCTRFQERGCRNAIKGVGEN